MIKYACLSPLARTAMQLSTSLVYLKFFVFFFIAYFCRHRFSFIETPNTKTSQFIVLFLWWRYVRFTLSKFYRSSEFVIKRILICLVLVWHLMKTKPLNYIYVSIFIFWLDLICNRLMCHEWLSMWSKCEANNSSSVVFLLDYSKACKLFPQPRTKSRIRRCFPWTWKSPSINYNVI